MCNDHQLPTDAATIFDDFPQLKIKVRFPLGKPNHGQSGRIKARIGLRSRVGRWRGPGFE